MNSNRNSDQQQLFESLSFSGEITASVTHELNNVLGTIEQVTGLIEDMAATDVAQKAGISDKLLDIVNRVIRQSDRGTALIKRLNAFAHLADNAVVECDLGELLENIVGLSERIARMNKVQLVTTGLDQKIIVKANPFMIVRTIYSAIKRAIQIADPSESIQINSDQDQEEAVITIDVRCGDSIDDSTEMTVASQGVRIEETTVDGRCSIKLVISSSR